MSGKAAKRASRAKPDDPTGRPLWTCPKCGNRFVTRNMWHSCTRYTHATFLEGKGPKALGLFRRFDELVRSCGPVTEVGYKTQAGYMVRVRFAGVTALSERGMTCGFWLKRRIESPRFAKVELIPPNDWIYRLRITSPDELDAEVRGWLREAYDVGRQEHLRKRA